MLSEQPGHGEVWGYRGREERRGGSQLHALQRGTKSLDIFLISYTKCWRAYTRNARARRAAYAPLISFSPKTVRVQPMTQINAMASESRCKLPSSPVPRFPTSTGARRASGPVCGRGATSSARTAQRRLGLFHRDLSGIGGVFLHN